MLDLLIRIAESLITVVGGPSLEEGTVMGALSASSTRCSPRARPYRSTRSNGGGASR